MDERDEVEGSEDEVSLPRNVGKTRRDGPSQGEVEYPGSGFSCNICGREKSTLPICGSGERNRLGPNSHRENLCGVGPGDGSHADGERTDEEVRANDDAFGDRIVAIDNPDASTIDDAPFTETALKSADEIQPKAHHQSTDQQERPTAPLINVDDRRN